MISKGSFNALCYRQLITQIAGELMSGPANDFLGKNNFIYTTGAARIIKRRKMGWQRTNCF